MKRTLSILAIAFASSSIISAQEKPDTLVVSEPGEVIVMTSSTLNSVSIKGSSEDPDYSYYREIDTGGSGRIYESENSGVLDFNLPFSDLKKEEEVFNPKGKGTFGAGFFKVYAGYIVSTADNPYNFGYWNSDEWGFSVLKYESRKLGSFFSFRPSLGFGFKGYESREDIMYQKVDGGVAVVDVPGNMNLKRSRIVVSSVTAPLMFDFYSRRDRIGFQFGPVVNLNFHSKLKNVYTLDGGDKQKDKVKNIHAAPLTVDYMAMLRFRALGFYVKYSPQSPFDTKYSPAMRNTVTVGLFIN